MINKIVGAVLAIVVGVAMLPVVLDSIDALSEGETPIIEQYPVVETLVELLPVLFVIILVVGAVQFIRTR